LQPVSEKEGFTYMANHKSAIKKIRADKAKRLRNRYKLTTTRTFEKRLRKLTSKSEAQELLNKVCSLFDKLAKSKVIHKNKASNHKSKLTRFVNAMS
jgi:small subunit ribosomal protein S20